MVSSKSVKVIDEIVQKVDALVQESIPQTSINSHVLNLVELFGSMAKEGLMSPETKEKKELMARKCLVEAMNDFIKTVAGFSSLAEEELAATCHAAVMKVILFKGKYAEEQSAADDLKTLCLASLAAKTNLMMAWEAFLRYDDVRFYFFNTIAASAAETENLQSLLDLLISMDSSRIPSSDGQIRKFYLGKPTEIQIKRMKNSSKGNLMKSSSQREAFRRAWIAVLQQKLSFVQVKEVLSVMHARIIPFMDKPALLMDFLTDAYNYGGTISLLSLNALFELIQHHGLDYPNFYRKLYSLLEDGSILVSSHRARFFRLLDLFLSSTHLPATIPASVMKRLARLSVYAPPGALVAVVPFIYNQLKRHPTCMLMIHRESNVKGLDADPFNPDEQDPLLTKALESSLWEIDALTSHYQPNVASIAKILSQPFHKPNYQLEHFLVHSYETLYDTENRRTGLIPTLEFEELNVFEGDLLEDWCI